MKDAFRPRIFRAIKFKLVAIQVQARVLLIKGLTITILAVTDD